MHSAILAEHKTQHRAAILSARPSDNNCQRVLASGFFLCAFVGSRKSLFPDCAFNRNAGEPHSPLELVPMSRFL